MGGLASGVAQKRRRACGWNGGRARTGRLMSQAVRGCRGPTFTAFVNVYSCGHCATLHSEIGSHSTSHISGPWMKNLPGCQLT